MRRLECRYSEQRDFCRWPDAVGEPPAGKEQGRAASRQSAGSGRRPARSRLRAAGRQGTGFGPPADPLLREIGQRGGEGGAETGARRGGGVAAADENRGLLSETGLRWERLISLEI